MGTNQELTAFYQRHEQAFLPLTRWTIRHPLHRKVERSLKGLAAAVPGGILVDVGSRRSPYTIGLPVRVVGVDLEDCQQINLGFVREKVANRGKQGYFRQVLGDARALPLTDGCADITVAVEVIEHILEDRLFLDNIVRVLKRGGTFYLTTPNGEAIPNKNPYHHRHYTRETLVAILQERFDDVMVEYRLPAGPLLTYSLRSMTEGPVLVLPFVVLGHFLANAIYELLCGLRVFTATPKLASILEARCRCPRKG